MPHEQVNRLLDQMQPNNTSSLGGLGSGLLGGVAGGALTSLLLNKKSRKMLGGAVKVGGIAALGGLAWKAYSQHQQNMQPDSSNAATQGISSIGNRPAPSQTLTEDAFAISDDTAAGQAKAWLMIQAMIAAANADGHIDDQERQRIYLQVTELDISREARGAVLDEFQSPADVKDIALQVTDPETAAEVYLASALAIDSSCNQGRTYLNALGFMLDLPADLATRLEEQAQTAG